MWLRSATQLVIGAHGKARLWINETAGAVYAPARVLEKVVPAFAPGGHEARAIVLEVRLPRGPRAEYGLLGARFTPDDSGHVTLRVGVSGAEGATFDSLAGSFDDVRVGLPEEYAGEVLGTLASLERLPAGVLEIHECAHGAVGSSRVLFARLAKLIAALADTRVDLSDGAAEREMLAEFAPRERVQN